jgi:DNA-binding NarL/FixJ family response regulator
MCLEANLGHGTFVRALDVVSAGAAYIEQVLQDHYSKSYPGLGDAPIEQLSEREREVLQLVAAGHANQEIAARLFISPETVKSHLSHIRGKLQARDRVHAAVRGIWLGLVDWPEPG